MKSVLALLAALFLVPVLAFADDELISIDATSGLITLQQNGTLKSYRIKSFTDITINGQKATAAQLKAGMQVSVGLLDPQTVSRVAARGNIAPPAPAPGATVASTPSPFFANRPTGPVTRRIVFKATIDGDDTVSIQNGKLRILHGGWQKPSEISVNGINWKTVWSDKASDDFAAFQPPLAPFTGANVSVKKIKGRGDIKIVEAPTETNGQKLVIHLQDEGSGASEFEVRITW